MSPFYNDLYFIPLIQLSNNLLYPKVSAQPVRQQLLSAEWMELLC